MPATAADLKFFGSAAPNDTNDGGGARAATVVQNGVLSNVFPSVSSADRATGRVSLRKIYPSMTNADLAPLLGASVMVNEVPSDPAVSVWMFKFGNQLTTRSQALTALKEGIASFPSSTSYWATGTATPGSDTITSISISNSVLFDSYVPNSFYLITQNLVSSEGPPGVVRRIVDRGASTITLDRAIPFTGSVIARPITSLPNGALRVYGAMKVYGPVATGDDGVFIESPIQLVPMGSSTPILGSTNFEGFGLAKGTQVIGGFPTDVYNYLWSVGTTRGVAIGDIVTLYHEAATSPDTAVNGTAINVGRTDVDQIAIVGANGLEIVRFLAGGPTPSPAVATVNLAAGTVTPINVTGWSQPVTVRHRIAHRSTATAVDGALVTLAAGPTRDFPAGSVLSTHLPLGDLQALVSNIFAQQAWTKQWSDTIIGSPATLMYAGLPTVTNAGAETDRYAVVFTSATAFDVLSERLGKVGSGTTAANFSPINPATGAPLFTLQSVAWGTGIPVSSVLRFNTTAAAGDIWVGRTVVPSAASGTVTANVRMTGSVD